MKLLTLAVLATLSTGAFAEDRSGMYLQDSKGTVVPAQFVSCIRTGFWTPPTPATATAMDCVCEKICKPAPAVVVVAPAPVVKPNQVTEKVLLSSDTLFAFDKSSLLPAGKVTLDGVVEQTKAMKVEVIIAVGHTDRFGSEAYNQRLSERRAESVKAYLASQGIPADKIYTEGKGERAPVTTSDKCQGRTATPSVKACLQPNRRVELEIIGTK